jgi:hypothetical protein
MYYLYKKALSSEDKLKKEKYLNELPTLKLVENIGSSLEELLGMRLDEFKEQRNRTKGVDESFSSFESQEGPSLRYEVIMQELEADIRSHISVKLMNGRENSSLENTQNR